MTTLFLIAFILGTLAVVFLMFFDSLGDQMPSACPRCGTPDTDISGGQPLVGAYSRWYREAPGRRYRCRHCQTLFRNHPNGALVEVPGA